MNLMRRQDIWEPLREFEELSSRFSRLFGLLGSGDGTREALALTNWAPACDISETETGYRVKAELPSVKKDDVHVTLSEGVLTIKGERKEEKEEKGEKFHRRELAYGNFIRRFTMPEDADENVDATFKDGVLDVAIAKTKAAKAPKAKEITVH